jgi:hypothetical protein
MKVLNALLVAGVAASASPATAGTTINFGTTPLSSPGVTSQTYTSGTLSVVASGFNASNAATGLYAKNDGGTEVGLGLVNDKADHEILFGNYIQVDVSALLGLASGVKFSFNSTTDGEQWSIFGSNAAHTYSGPALAFGGTNTTSIDLPVSASNAYYDIVSTTNLGGKNILLKSMTINSAVPEPATWAMMLIGFGGTGAAMRRTRKRVVAQIA